MSQQFEQDMGDAIRRARDASGYTLRSFAERLETFGLPISYAALARIESAKRPVTVRELLVIAAALDTSPDVLAIPHERKDGPVPLDYPVPLTDTLVEPTGAVRAWWSGRGPLLGTRRRRPRPTWPAHDGLSGDALRERDDHWQSRRPITERRAYSREGVRTAVAHLDRLIQAAGRNATPSAQDRAAMATELLGLVRAVRRLLEDPDLARTDELRDDEAIDEMKAALAAAGEAHERNQRGES